MRSSLSATLSVLPAFALFVCAKSVFAGDSGDVVVTGTKSQLANGSRDDTAASSVVPRDVLARAGGTVADGLRTQPGVIVSATGSSSDLSTALVRGATSAELPVYLAGVRINDELTGTADLSTLPAWMLSRAEIYRGNAPIDADRSGIGGALFLEPLRPRGPLLGAQATVGSYGYRALSVMGGSGDENASVLLAVRKEDADNGYPYLDDQGTRFVRGDDRVVLRANADSHALDAWAVSRLTVGDTRWSAVVSGFSREQGVPGLGLVPALAARSRTTRALSGVRGAIPCGKLCELTVALSAIDSSRVLSDPRRELGLEATALSQTGIRVEPSAKLSAQIIDGLRLAGATDLSRESLSVVIPASRFVADRTFLRGSLQAQVTPASLLRLGAQASVEHSATSAAGVASDDSPASFRLSERLGDDTLALLFNLSRAVRIPTLGELYGQSSVVRGNPDLLPERATSFDLGGRAATQFSLFERASRLETNLFGFTRAVSNLVAYRRASLGDVRPYNVGDAHVRGIEADLATTLAARLVLRESLTLEDARDVSPDRQQVNDILPFRPRLVSASRAALLLGDLVGLPVVEVGVDLLHEASRFADTAGLEVIPQQTTLDVDVTVAADVGPTRVTARGRVTNLTDATVFDLVGYPLPPRRTFVSLEVVY